MVLAKGITDQEIVFSPMVKVICCYDLPWAIRYVLGKHRLEGLSPLVLGIDGTSLDIVVNVSI